jgi:hypothetical protein
MNTTKKLPHARIHLPPLSADYALTFVAILEAVTRAIWRAHGDRMAELLALRDSDASLKRARRRHPLRDDGDPDAPDDIPF